MEILLVILLTGFAFTLGEGIGYRNGRIVGRMEAHAQQRLDALAKPWQR